MDTRDKRITRSLPAPQVTPTVGNLPLPQEPPLLTEAAAAKRLGVSPQYLVKWRFLGRPALPFVRIGNRMIRYRMADLDAFIRSRVVATEAPHPRYDADHPTTRK
jgi:hypothetical protein